MSAAPGTAALTTRLGGGPDCRGYPVLAGLPATHLPERRQRAVRIAVRHASLGDLAAVVALAAALWPEEPLREHRRHMRATLTGRPLSTLPLVVLVAERRARIVGFIEGWFVCAAERGRGIGRALMRAAEKWSLEQGRKEMASDTWIDSEAAQRAHLALGFEVVDRCVHLRKQLGPAR